MGNGLLLFDGMAVQDRDLLTRLTHYFETLETRLEQGQGWFIFNARGQRSRWLGRFVSARLGEYRPLISSFVMPWRDFALNAYVTEVELPARSASVPEPPSQLIVPSTADHVEREYRLATGVSRATAWQMRQCDLLVVQDLRPTQRHEVNLLSTILTARHHQRRATMLLTGRAPHELAAEITAIDGDATTWERLWTAMYERSLIAL